MLRRSWCIYLHSVVCFVRSTEYFMCSTGYLLVSDRVIYTTTKVFSYVRLIMFTHPSLCSCSRICAFEHSNKQHHTFDGAFPGIRMSNFSAQVSSSYTCACAFMRSIEYLMYSTVYFHISNWVILHNHECLFMHSINCGHTSKSAFHASSEHFSHSNECLHAFDGAFPGIRMSNFLHSREYCRIFG